MELYNNKLFKSARGLMKIICNEEELKSLVKLGVLKAKSLNEYYIETKPDFTGKSQMILVSLSEEEELKNGILKAADYLAAFPTSVQYSKLLLPALGEVPHRNLRTGTTSKLQPRLKVLAKKYKPEEIISMIKLEIDTRVKSSFQNGQNALQYMQGAASWLNNDGNMEALYEELKNINNLQQYYVFFYEKKGGKVRGVLGKDRTKDLIRAIL